MFPPPVDNIKQHWQCRTAPHIKAQMPTTHSAACGHRHSRHAKYSHTKNSRASCRPTPLTCHAKNSHNGRPKTPTNRALIGRPAHKSTDANNAQRRMWPQAQPPCQKQPCQKIAVLPAGPRHPHAMPTNSHNGRHKPPISRALIDRRYRGTLGPIANVYWLYNTFIVPELRPIVPAIVPVVVPAVVYSTHCSTRHSTHARHYK